ncbi:MAG: hypothetical protein EBZ77_09445, partial [Chitinophagia bacterium]|nr:hypothetical protein [Chitinophagia bacterium]
MRKIYGLAVSFLVSAATAAQAQDIVDAYNISNSDVQGTARSLGFGSALGSIGADFSTLSVNPAGIGLYRASEITFSPSLKAGSSNAQFLGATTSDNNTRFNINNLGIVFTNAPTGKRYQHRAWKTVSFGVGINRVADFNRNYTYRGVNTTGSASQSFEADANYDTTTINTLGTLGNLGYDAGLLAGTAGSSFISVVPYEGGIVQENAVKERGRINELVFSLGGNYRERLMLGATLGVPTVRYTRQTSYTETILASNTYNPYNFTSFTYDNKIDISGTGVNLKIGAIYKIAKPFRIGAALHLPTVYWLHMANDYGIRSDVDGYVYSTSTDGHLPQYTFDYRITTPLKFVGSAAIVLKKIGFITADFERLNYATMRFGFPSGIDESSGRSYSYLANQYNQNIRNTYQAASNVRIGAEIRITPNFMIRGGYGYYGSAYKGSTDYNHIDISAGLGFNSQNFFADVAVVNRRFSAS